MKILSSSLLENDIPIADGMDLALAFAQANQQPIEAFVARRTADLQQVTASLDAQRNHKAFLRGAILAGVSAVLIPFSFKSPMFLTLNFFGITGGSGWAYSACKKQRAEILKLESQKREIPNRPIPQLVSHLGKLHYVVNVVPFEGGQLVLDATGTRQKHSLTYPEIPDGINRLRTLGNKLSQIPDELPILLQTRGETDLQERHHLLGIEADMGEVLSMTDQIFSTTIDISTELPAFKAQDGIVHSLRMLSQHFTEGEPSLHLAQSDPMIAQALQSLAQTSLESAEAKKLGSNDVESLMSDAVTRMDHCVTQAKAARDRSLMSILGDGLDRIKGVYDYPLTRFYCPKCHKVELFHQANLPVPLDRITDVPIDALDALHRSHDIQRLRSVVDKMRHYLMQSQQRGEDFSSNHLTILQNRIETYEERIKDLAVEIPEFDPKVEVHKRNAVLKYNTIQQQWTCQLCSSAFSEEEAQWSRMLKVKDDLILPVWDTLWLEKHDERNRIIREKESELRDNLEHEAALSREEAKLFTEEFRPVRDQLDGRGGSSRAAQRQIEMMMNFYQERGILSEGTRHQLQMYVQTQTQDISATSVIQDACNLEEQLGEEAEVVLVRRSQLRDHADEVRNATKYFVAEVPALRITHSESTKPNLLNETTSHSQAK